MPSSQANSAADIWIAGAAAAFTVDILVYPLDTIKTRLQSSDYRKLYRNANNTGFNPALFRGLYQGLGSIILTTLPASGAFFSTYEGIKAILGGNGGDGPQGPSRNFLPQPVINAIASGSAELVSCALLTPAEVIKQNAQMISQSAGNKHGEKKKKVSATLVTLQRFRSNPFALWRGYAALAGRNLPFTALSFPLFERIREGVKMYRDERGLRTNTLFENGAITAVSAGTGSSIAALVTTPVDVIKTRIMLEAGKQDEGNKNSSAEGKGNARPAKDALVDATGKAMKSVQQESKETVHKAVKEPSRLRTVQIVREIVQEQGVRGLFRGGALRAVWTMVGSGLYLGVYESGRIYLANRRGVKLTAEDLES